MVLNLAYSTDTSKHTSLGNGVDDFIGGVDVGDDTGVGLGLGFLYGNNQAKFHFLLKYTATGKATLGRSTLLDAHEDLSLTMSSYALADRSNVSMYIRRLDDLDWTTSAVGFNWSIKMLPR